MKEKDYESLTKEVKYDPETGEFTWLTTSVNKRRRKGQIAGTLNRQRYMAINFNYVQYKAHRLAFFIMTGVIPPIIDHINGVKSDNAWVNLREVTRSQNAINQPPRKHTTAVSKGVSRVKNKLLRPWKATITLDGKQKHLGYFDTEEAASRAYQSTAVIKHGEYRYEKS